MWAAFVPAYRYFGLRAGNGSRLRGTHASRLLQRRGQILDQIVRMLEPRREADEALADAERGAVLRLQALMRRGRRMRDEALGVAEIVARSSRA